MQHRPRTLVDKIWESHLVSAETAETPAVLYVDLHLVHEVTSPQAFAELRARGLRVRRPERTVATMDHAIPTRLGADGRRALPVGAALEQVTALERNCRDFGVPLYPVGDERQGIVHVIGPELGLTHPGSTIVCGDSHTSTHGAFGALAFGIGTSEVGHVLATQCLLQRRPKSFAVEFTGALAPGVGAKDLILGADRAHRHCRRHRPRARVPRQRHPLAHDGRADDGLQHVDRSRGPRGPRGAGRHHLRVPRGPAVRAQRRGTGTRPWRAGARCRATPRPPSTASCRSTPRRSSR